MSVADIPTRKKYDCDGVVQDFPITFQYYSDDTVKVKHIDSNDNVTLLILDDVGVNGFTIVSNEVVTNTLYPDTDFIWLIRETPRTQTTIRENNRRTPASVDDGSFDKLTFIVQENEANEDRSIHLSDTTDTDVSSELPAPVAGMMLAWDSLGKAFQNVAPLAGSVLLNEDDMASNSETQAATQQSIVKYIRVFNSVADLNSSTGPFKDGQSANILGYHSGSLAGGGVVTWYATSTDAADDCVTFKVDSIAIGRFKRPETGEIIAEQCGVTGDGVTVDTIRAQAMLDTGILKARFSGNSYVLGSLVVPEEIEIDGLNSTIIPTGTPTQIFSITDKPNVHIHNFILNGNCTYFIHVQGGLSRFDTFEKIKVSGGTGTAVIRYYNNSDTNGPTRAKIWDIDARVANWDHAVLCERGATAEANNIGMDNFDIRRINAWPEVSTIKIGLPASAFQIDGIYGALLNATATSVVHIDTDSGHAEGLKINNIHAEGWHANQRAVHLVGVQYSRGKNIRSIRINNTKSGQRAVKCEDVKFCEFKNFGIRDTGFDFSATPAGFYPAIEFDSSSHDNRYSILDNTIVANRVSDSGYRNILENDYGDKGFYNDNARDSLTGTTDETTLKTYTIGANELASTDSFKVMVSGSVSGVNDTKTIKFKWGGSTISGASITGAAGDTGAWSAELVVSNLTTSSQRISTVSHAWSALEAMSNTTGAIDTTANAVFSITGELANVGDTINIDQFMIIPIRKTSL